MELNRREFIKRFGYTWVSLLVFDGLSIAEEIPEQEEAKLILPTLEEITALLSKTPQEILEPSVKRGLIKKFGYTRQTTTEEFYRFLNDGFNDQFVFIFADTDMDTIKKNKGFKTDNLNAGAAIVFYYSAKNLQNSDVACIFLEFTDFYGEQHWNRAKLTFQNRLEGLPSYVEFVRKNESYIFADITGTSLRDPEKILKYIPLYVDDFRKRTSK